MSLIDRLVFTLRLVRRNVAAALSGHHSDYMNFEMALNTPSALCGQEQDRSLDKGILWAVPKQRRTVEKRLKRKFGWPDYHWKPLVPKRNLILCNSCGHHYEAHHLCPTCYNKVKVETKAIQDAIQNELKLEPVEKEVVVLYEGEMEGRANESWQGKRIIEMKKRRPEWFSKNLLQKTTQTISDSSNVKPTDLA